MFPRPRPRDQTAASCAVLYLHPPRAEVPTNPKNRWAQFERTARIHCADGYSFTHVCMCGARGPIVGCTNLQACMPPCMCQHSSSKNFCPVWIKLAWVVSAEKGRGEEWTSKRQEFHLNSDSFLRFACCRDSSVSLGMLHVTSLSGEKYAVPAKDYSDARALKTYFSRTHGLPPRFQQRMLLEGNELEDSTGLEACMELNLLLLPLSCTETDKLFTAIDKDLQTKWEPCYRSPRTQIKLTQIPGCLCKSHPLTGMLTSCACCWRLVPTLTPPTE